MVYFGSSVNLTSTMKAANSRSLFKSLGQLLLLAVIGVLGGVTLIGVSLSAIGIKKSDDESSFFQGFVWRWLIKASIMGLVVAAAVVVLPLIISLGLLPTSWFAWTPSSNRSKNLGRRRFHPREVAEAYDVIIIGSGIAGLTTAAVLTILGRKVCVLEAHEVAGGGTHVYHVGGNVNYQFPSGLHYVIPNCQQVLQISCLARAPPVLFPKLGIAGSGVYERLRLPRVEAEDVPIVDAVQFLQELHQRYPSLGKQLDRYESLALSVLKGFPLWCALHALPWWIREPLLQKLMPSIWWEYAGRSAEDVLTEVFVDAPPDQQEQVHQLQAYLCALWVDTGCPPHRVSFFMIAAVGLGFPREGGAYPQGGPQSMSMTLVERIEASKGSSVFCRASVQEVLVDQDGKAIGVKVAGGTNILANQCIVSACGWRNTSRLLSNAKTAFPKLEELQVPQGEGFCMANIGLKGDDLQLECCNLWPQPAGAHQSIFEGVRNYLEHPLDVPVTEIPLMITFPSMKDRSYPNGNQYQTAQMLALAKTEWFGDIQDTTSAWKQPKRSSEYQGLKERWTERLKQAFVAYYPHLKDKIELFDVSTPLSIEHYLPSKSGSAIGLDVCADKNCRFTSLVQMKLLDMKTPVQNLWMTGQDTLLCGVPLAQAAGLITALRIAGPFGAARFLFQAIWILLASMGEETRGNKSKAKEA
jgi:all-trans-retinol 13,14-reductase